MCDFLSFFTPVIGMARNNERWKYRENSIFLRNTIKIYYSWLPLVKLKRLRGLSDEGRF